MNEIKIRKTPPSQLETNNKGENHFFGTEH